jgi:hypothetical protein
MDHDENAFYNKLDYLQQLTHTYIQAPLYE